MITGKYTITEKNIKLIAKLERQLKKARITYTVEYADAAWPARLCTSDGHYHETNYSAVRLNVPLIKGPAAIIKFQN